MNGDVIDRGQDGIRILKYMMTRPNICPIIGNHEYALYQVLKFITLEITEESIKNIDADSLRHIIEYQSIGGRITLDAFCRLYRDEQNDITDYLKEFSAYEEVSVNGREFVIVYAGLSNFSPERKLRDYKLWELIFKAPDYEKVYFKDKYLITGHLPTRAISGAKPDEIYFANNHIAIDCGAGIGGNIGCIRLDDFKCFYGHRKAII